ncbi:ComF family protein [Fusibacter paucivorans]|uniref:ComF family protein n=1 Tax=Fusibacter paucivorans TaxID=76009 RepID=A0ABS5PP26_9FIRM|nr:ComF family protein [Fusibacter paucivorans]MBS7525797.1 ComF family protein [Fusibacter paucivorans]
MAIKIPSMPSDAFRGLGKPMLDLIFPIHVQCAICEDEISGESYFCESCMAKTLVSSDQICMKCGRPLELSREHYRAYGGICPICQTHFSYFKYHRAFTLYEGRAKQLLLSVKYKGNLQYTPIIAEGMARALHESPFDGAFDIIVPVPIHKRRQLFRGFNQAAVYAEALSAYDSEIPVIHLLKRVKSTKKLKNLDKEARNRMMENAIIIEKSQAHLIDGKSVLLVDDIFTTGATLNACARALYESGADSIFAITFAMGK